MRLNVGGLLWLPFIGLAYANEVVYVTDLQLFTELAPCAQSALSNDIMTLTYSSCPPAVSELQKCICSKSAIMSALSSSISSDVSYSCGAVASEDQASASTVLNAYCNQDDLPVFPTPTYSVDQYIQQIAELQYLAPCAAEQLTYAVESMTYQYCPPDAAALATCVCNKNQNSLMVSQTINTAVSQGCSSNTADISSAQAFFKAYCNMISGTSVFPTASDPPGDMSYYITDIPDYSSQPRCVQSAISYGVFTNTYAFCPGGPQLLASCVCLKPSVSGRVSSYITHSISNGCSGDAQGITSALSIFGMYCSAAANKVVISGIVNSVAQTVPSGVTGTATHSRGATAPTKATTKPGGTATDTQAVSTSGSTAAAGAGGTGGTNGSGNSDDGDSKSNTGVIVGAVVGVVGGLAVLAVATFLVFRHVRKNKKQNEAFQQLDNLPPNSSYGGKAELSGTPLAAGAGAGIAGGAVVGNNSLKPPLPPPSPNPSSHHGFAPPPNSTSPAPSDISPMSGHPGAGTGQSWSPPPELPGQMYNPNGPYPPPQQAELPGQQSFVGHPPAQAELYSGYAPATSPTSPYGHGPGPVYSPSHSPAPPAGGPVPTQGMSWQSGPVQSYELEGGGPYNQPQSPHAR